MIKKIILIVCAFLFFILGVIGLLLPVIPQVPFLLAACFFMATASSRFRHGLVRSRLYRKYIQKHVEKHRKLYKFLHEEAS